MGDFDLGVSLIVLFGIILVAICIIVTMKHNAQANEKYGINQLRFGDFVAVLDHDSTYGPHYKQGAITIGVVVHSDSFTSGHGPGLTIVATSSTRAIEPVVDAHANLANYTDVLLKR